MKRIIYIVSILFLLCLSKGYSQNIPKEKTTKKDTTQKLFNDSLMNKIKQEKFSHNEFPLIFNNKYYTNPDSIGLNSKIKLNMVKIVPDPLANFNKNLHAYLAYCYNSTPNYDLGIVGQYLLYLKKMAALYLAVLAVM